jgi:hypothetical protein
VAWEERGDGFTAADGDCLVDLGDLRDSGALVDAWLLPALAAMNEGTLRELRLDFQDGAGCRLLGNQRWRFWRKPAAGFARR